MDEVATDARFELNKITDTEWLILDHRYRSDDSRRTVACIYEMSPVEVEVIWLREVSLCASYSSPLAVLDDVRGFFARSRARRPREIPHLPPFVAKA